MKRSRYCCITGAPTACLPVPNASIPKTTSQLIIILIPASVTTARGGDSQEAR